MTFSKPQKISFSIFVLTLISLYIVLPAKLGNFLIPRLNFKIGNLDFSKEIELKQGLDIKGGLQVVLNADMKDIAGSDRTSALESLKEVIGRRVDLFGVSESGVKKIRQTSKKIYWNTREEKKIAPDFSRAIYEQVNFLQSLHNDRITRIEFSIFYQKPRQAL